MSQLKLELASLEMPEFVQSDSLYRGTNRYEPNFEQIVDQSYEDGQRVVVDNRQFLRCTFRTCVLVYSGGMYGFRECTFDSAHTKLDLTGSAVRALALFEAISRHPETGSWVPRHSATFG